MPETGQRGIAHFLLLILLVAGIGLGVYLVNQKTNLFPWAASNPTNCPISGPCYTAPPSPSFIPSPSPTPVIIPLFRMYQRDQGRRLWTTDQAEIDFVKQRGFISEGIAFSVFKKDQVLPGAVPVYRMYLRDRGLRFYTSTDAERKLLTNGGWINEGIVFLVYKDQKPGASKGIYRLINSADSAQRFWTSNKAEVDFLKERGWNLEQIDFYVPNQ